jgi:all-trans-nonaprenyl-diphosphate synthase
MIHTASLVHDDVLDECDTRRGQPTVNAKWGNKNAVLVGDFLFARSSYLLAHLENNEVIKLISQVIADFADGEINQSQSQFDTDLTIQQYLDKSYYKTATLIASSCRASAIFSGVDADVKHAMFEYGRHLGLAFQVVDDILDFTRTSEELGKPQGQDLMSGNLTAPALYALQHEEHGPELRALIDSEFNEAGGLPRAIQLVRAGGGIEQARTLARTEAEQGLQCLACLPESDAKESLKMMISYVLERLY